MDVPNTRSKLVDDAFAENPIVYFLLTDRFCRGGGTPPSRAAVNDPGTFHGGKFAGVTRRIQEGWFNALGVNALWISAPYEQIRGWVASENDEFRHEAYHGYWPLDFTVVEPRFGSRDDFKDMVDCAHAHGLKVILDVVMSHTGYPDLATLLAFVPDAVLPGWENATPKDYKSFMAMDTVRMAKWWGPEWVRAEIDGYPDGGDDDLTRISYGLPKFLTESDAPVSLPAFLRDKPDTEAIHLDDTPVRGYLISWLCAWVRRYGIDGFRCDSVKHVDGRCWSELKAAAGEALRQWRAEHTPDVDDADFWMTGEVFGGGIEYARHYDHGFDNLINFRFQGEAKAVFRNVDMNSAFSRGMAWRRLDKLYARYADVLSESRHNVLSYLSSHDTELFDRVHLRNAATALMLLPGGVQIFYGDESGRKESDGVSTLTDACQVARSDMNWESIDTALLEHWRKLGRFRAGHPAIGRGKHIRLSEEPYVFARMHGATGDTVLVALGPGDASIEVGALLPDHATLHDAYSGEWFDIDDGILSFRVDELRLFELAPSLARSSGRLAA
ncbi:alpha-amylase family glycosyl hydrolase [Luteibacter sp. PPL554]